MGNGNNNTLFLTSKACGNVSKKLVKILIYFLFCLWYKTENWMKSACAG